MNICTHDEWLANLRPGDAGIIDAKNPFAWLQDLYRKKFKEGEHSASHGFVVAEPPTIVESNGWKPSYAFITKFIGDTTKCWVFRNKDMSGVKWEKMKSYADGAIEMGGHYGIGNIIQFGLQFLGIRKKLKDASGQFCSEFSSNLIQETNLPYNVGKPFYEITPSLQLNYFYSEQAKKDGWFLVCEYNGKDYLKS